MAHTTTAFAPASMGNVSLGFDILGAALQPIDGSQLGDTVAVTDAPLDQFSVKGRFADKLPPEPNSNIVLKCRDFFRQKLADKPQFLSPVAIELSKNLPIGSGLGSSASSIVAAFAALNAHFGEPFDSDTLLLMMGECEGQISGSIHYDNVAPSYLGGMTFMTGLSSPLTLSLPVINEWYWTVCYSGLSVSTAAARDILPQQYPVATTLAFGKQLGGFIHALHCGNAKLAAAMMQDVIAEPYRQDLLPGFAEARRAATQRNALAFGISGSGPTVFAVSDNSEQASEIAQWLQTHYVKNETGFSHVCRIPEHGIEIQKS